jgi:hypothetical protein
LNPQKNADKNMREPNVTAAKDSVVIEIGNTSTALNATDYFFQQLLKKRYAPFVKPSRNVHSQFNIELIEPRAKDQRRASTLQQDLQVKMDGSQWTFHRGDFDADWDPQTGIGRIRQSSNPYSPDAVLRIVHSLILASEGGFLIHSASAVRNGCAFLFTGVSGAGKTTISRLAPPDVTLLTDEISYVRPDGAGYRAFGTPFAGELSKPGENISAPLSALYFLEKGPDNRIEVIPPNEAIRKLLRNILFFADDPELVNLVFQSACNFVEKVPMRKLVFVPDQRVWETIHPAGK